jgi:uncharacterized protein (TIGR00255 family)
MISSMTGFASNELELEAGTLLCEIRSVNHRYLETGMRLPEGFRAIEPELRKLVSEALNRGKVDISLSFQAANKEAPKLELNTKLAEEIIKHSNSISNLLKQDSTINPLTILRWPGVLREEALDMESLQEPASGLLTQSLEELRSTRASEGARIHDMLEERLQQILDISAAVSARLPEVLENSRARMRERAEVLEQKIDPERLEQELLILAQKQDVAEELDRLQAHVAEIREILTSDDAVGRRLDFMMQELNREANTLGSKSADPVTSKCAVDLKVLIEQMREQVQNIE